MAVLNNTEYYKIDPNKSYVDSFINVYYDVYDSEKERLKEKDRESKINIFIYELIKLDTEFSEYCSSKTFSTDDEWDFAYNNDLEFHDAVDTNMAVNTVISNYKNMFYRVNGLHQTYEFPKFMLALGAEQEWIDDPISYTVGGITNCGIYDGEPVSYSLYYNALKKIMFGECIDLL